MSDVGCRKAEERGQEEIRRWEGAEDGGQNAGGELGAEKEEIVLEL